MHFFYYSIKNLFLFLIPALLAGYFWGLPFALGVYVACVLFWIFGHLLQLSFFVRFLYRPDIKKLPEGIGIWQTIFSMIKRREKRQRRQRKERNRTLQRFYRIHSLMPDGSIIINNKGRIEWMNKPVQKHLNINEFLDMNGRFVDIFDNEDLTSFIEDPEKEGEPFFLTVRDNTPSHSEMRIVLKHSRFDKEHVIIFTQDVTKLVKLDSMRRDFVANVSHELRMPLTVINGFVETMMEMPQMEKEDRDNFLTLMKTEGDRMNTLLNDLLILSKIENEDREGVKAALNASAVAHRVFEAAKAISDGKHEMSADIDDDLWIFGIEGDFYAGLSNMVFNAVRYTPDGGSIKMRFKKKYLTGLERMQWLRDRNRYQNDSDEADEDAQTVRSDVERGDESFERLYVSDSKGKLDVSKVIDAISVATSVEAGFEEGEFFKDEEDVEQEHGHELAHGHGFGKGIGQGRGIDRIFGLVDNAAGNAGREERDDDSQADPYMEAGASAAMGMDGAMAASPQKLDDDSFDDMGEGDWYVLFEVEDTGVGIAKEHIPRLTERFYRVDSGRSRKMGGTGLGLAITKHVLHEHNSELKIESEPGKGSTFSCLVKLFDKPVDLGK